MFKAALSVLLSVTACCLRNALCKAPPGLVGQATLPCTEVYQRFTLVAASLEFGVTSWRNASGWPLQLATATGLSANISLMSLFEALSTMPISTGVCQVTTLQNVGLAASNWTAGGVQITATSASIGRPQMSATSAEPQALALPDYCCWFGITCCTPFYCPKGSSCNCPSFGLVTSVSLSDNNLKGRFEKIVSLASTLACSLTTIDLQDNALTGPVPEDITALPHLQNLNLAYNLLTGMPPSSLTAHPQLQFLDLSSNSFSGTIDYDLCNSEFESQLSGLFIAKNNLSGGLNVSSCKNLIVLDASFNNFSDYLIVGSNHLSVVSLQNNSFNVEASLNSLMARGHVTVLNIATQTANQSDIQSRVHIPPTLSGFRYLNSLNLLFINAGGPIPDSLFQLGSLQTLQLADNWISGTIPETIGKAGSLITLDLSYNCLTGHIPDSVAGLIAISSYRAGLYSSKFDFRLNFLSCCGVGPLIHDTYWSSVSYASYNASMPRLPKGLAFSKVLSPVVNPPYAQGTYQTILGDTVLTSYWNLGNASYHGLNCPNILIENFPDSPAFYLNWMLDPEYYLYEGCQCTQGTMMVTHEYHGLTVPQCVEISQNSLSWWNQMPWIFIIVALVAAAVLVGLAWYFLLRRASRPQILQDLIDMRRRIKGPSTAGTVSFVVTDIEGFTGLMKEYPDLAMSALIIHNNLIQKAKWDNFGTVIEQEGDSFTLMFEGPLDATKFCLQVQLLLAKQKWPKGLFETEAADSFSHTRNEIMLGFNSILPDTVKRMMSETSKRLTTYQSKFNSTSMDRTTASSAMTARGFSNSSLFDQSNQRESNRSTEPRSTDPRSTGQSNARGNGLQTFGSPCSISPNPGIAAGLFHTPSVTMSSLPEQQGSDQELHRLNFPTRPSSSTFVKLSTSSSRQQVTGVPAASSFSVATKQASGLVGSFTTAGRQSYMFPQEIDSRGASVSLSNTSAQGIAMSLIPSSGRQAGGVPGLRVRMGIATGQLQEGQAPGDCPVGRVAKVVSDAAQGGQVLMCSHTFMRVKDSAGELGSVTEDGFKIRADPERIMWWGGRRRKSSGDQHSGQALLLDMGHYTLSVEAAASVHDGSVSEGHQSSKQHGAAAGGLSSSPTAITTCSPAADIDVLKTSKERDKSLPVCTIPSAAFLNPPSSTQPHPPSVGIQLSNLHASGHDVCQPRSSAFVKVRTASADIRTSSEDFENASSRRGKTHRSGSLGIFRSSWASPSPPQTSRHTLAEVPAPAGASAAPEPEPEPAPEPAQAENSSPKTWSFGELDLFKRLSDRLAITSTEHNTNSNGVGGAALLLCSNQDHLIDTNNTGHGAASSSSSAHSHRQIRVYQVLAPMLLERGPFFGNKVHLPEGSWEQDDDSYFDAPGAVEAFPKGQDKGQDSSLSCPLLPTVTTVFSMVEGGRHFASGHRLEAKNMVAELEALMLQISRQLSGSYFVRQQEGEFKFMFVFCSPEAALMWCLAVQESSLYLNWSPAVQKHWPSELSVEGDLLFRGPRLKMGVCEGRPLSIMPDHMGRADYHGPSINLASRLMGAGAHGGQVVCKEELFLNLVMSRQLQLEAAPSSPASSKMVSTLRASKGSAGRIERQDGSGARWKPPEELIVSGSTFEVVAQRLGGFRFKGFNDLHSLVSVSSEVLSSRRFPSDPPLGKGIRVHEGAGTAGTMRVPVLLLMKEVREHYLTHEAAKMSQKIHKGLGGSSVRLAGYLPPLWSALSGRKGRADSTSALAYSSSEDESGRMGAANTVTTVGGAGNSQQAAASSSSSSSSIMFQAVPESAPMELVMVPQVIVDPTASTLVWREDSSALQSQISPFGLAPLLESQ